MVDCWVLAIFREIDGVLGDVDWLTVRVYLVRSNDREYRFKY